MSTNILIRGALVIDPARKLETKMEILVRDGRIEAAAPSIPAGPGVKVFDASGLWLMPGIIDMHVHTREPGMEAAENLASAACAAAAGGVTSILAMPNTEPPADDPALIRRLRARAEKLPVNICFSAAVTRARAGKRLAPLLALKKAGAKAFTDDGSCVSDSRLMKRALRLAKKLGIPLLDHAESFALTGPGVMHDCPLSRRLGLPGISRESEIYMVLRDLLLASPGEPLHIQHLSCRESVELTAAAKRRGLKVTAETCPHYFTLVCGDVKNAAFKMKPPLRERGDRAAVRRGLADGSIDAIASDHAPHTTAAKAAGLLKAPFGIIGLETMLGLALTELVHKGVISKLRLAELLSANPARILGLTSKGGLSPGMDADIVLIDPAVEYRVGPRFRSRSSNSPFIGRRLKGRAAATMVRGRFVFSL